MIEAVVIAGIVKAITAMSIKAMEPSSPAPKSSGSASPVERCVSVLVLDLVGYSTINQCLDENLGVNGTFELDKQIKNFIFYGLDAAEVPHDSAVMKSTGDGAIVVFPSPAEVIAFAMGVHRQTHAHNHMRRQPLAKRVFRMGAATGKVIINNGNPRETDFSGSAITVAARLEPLSTPGGILIDVPTFEGLAVDDKAPFAGVQEFQGKRGERFQAHGCVMNPEGPLDGLFFSASRTPR